MPEAEETEMVGGTDSQKPKAEEIETVEEAKEVNEAAS
jgi:hypothetical protein